MELQVTVVKPPQKVGVPLPPDDDLRISHPAPPCGKPRAPGACAPSSLSDFENFLSAKLRELQVSVVAEVVHQFGVQQDGKLDSRQSLAFAWQHDSHDVHRHGKRCDSAKPSGTGSQDSIEDVNSGLLRQLSRHSDQSEEHERRATQQGTEVGSSVKQNVQHELGGSHYDPHHLMPGSLHDPHHSNHHDAHTWHLAPPSAMSSCRSSAISFGPMVGAHETHNNAYPEGPAPLSCSKRTSHMHQWAGGSLLQSVLPEDGHGRVSFAAGRDSHRHSHMQLHLPGGHHPMRSSDRHSCRSVASVGSIFGVKMLHDEADDMKEFQPLHFEVLDTWKDGNRATQRFITQRSGPMFKVSTGRQSHSSPRTKTGPSVLFGPNSSVRLVWNVMSIQIIAYDCFMIPMDFFDMPEDGFILTMAWLVRIFWAFDMLMSTITGYVKSNGDFENRLWPCIQHYLRTWFLLDFVILIIDWLYVALDGANRSAAKMSKALRVLRLLRMSRLLRLARVVSAVEQLFDNIHSEKVTILVGLTKSMCLIICLIHVIACVWFGMGNTSNGWVTAYGANGQFRWDQYAQSLHWSMTQFFGSPDIFPVNARERFFSVCVLVFAFVVATWLVSSITSNMTRLHIISRGQQAQIALLRRYLSCRHISQQLSARVQLNATHTLEMKHNNVQEGDVELLHVVSEPLLMELHFEIYSPILLLHPFFHAYYVSAASVMRKICHVCVHTMTLMAGDVLFQNGEVPTNRHMLFCKQGRMRYEHASRESHFAEHSTMKSLDSRFGNPKNTMVHNNQWACEAVVWTNWVYCGTLQATDVTDLMVLDGEMFCMIANKYQGPLFRPFSYAEKYVTKLNEQALRATDLGTGIDSCALVDEAYGEEMWFHPKDSDEMSFAGHSNGVGGVGGILRGIKKKIHPGSKSSSRRNSGLSRSSSKASMASMNVFNTNKMHIGSDVHRIDSRGSHDGHSDACKTDGDDDSAIS